MEQRAMEDEAAVKRRRLEHHRGLSDAPGLSSFHMEDLPEEIQPLVLSLLSLKEAARTSIVSRNWRKLWTCHPKICFDGTKDDRPTDEDAVKIERAKFIETVNSVVQRHSGIGLNKFSIRCGLQQESSDHLDRWIYFATAAKAKIIEINLWSKRITKRVYPFALEALHAQDGPFIESLFLMVDFHVPGLVHFDYQGDVIPVQLHGCSKLEKASVTFRKDNKELGHAFSAIPCISAVNVLNMHADMDAYHPVWASPVHMVATRPACMFTNLRHLTCEISIYTADPNGHSELLQLAHYLALVPQLETLRLHMMYLHPSGKCWQGEVTGEGGSCMRRLDHLKTVYMSGFRCYRAQVELLCGILENGPAIEQVNIEPQVILRCSSVLNCSVPYSEIRKWARATSEQFGKVIAVARLPPIEAILANERFPRVKLCQC